MKFSSRMFVTLLLGALVACGGGSSESTIGTSHAAGVQRYATVRDLVAGAEQPQPAVTPLCLVAGIALYVV